MSIPCYPSGTKEWMHSGVVTGTYTSTTPVYMAVMPYDVEPERDSDVWHEAEWHTATGTVRAMYGGDTGIGTLNEGKYVIWVKPVTAQEEPLIRSGPINIT
ncbi:hypothetical protein ABZ917_17450 [Nonomuraea wenchangensis]